MRAVVAAPTDVQADRLPRDVAQRVVERVDAHLGELAVLRNAQLRVYLPPVQQVWVVYLEDEPCVCDGFVLLVHGVGDRVDEGFLVGVVLVPEPVLDAARRHGGEERLLLRHPLERALEVGDVGLDALAAHVGQRPRAEQLAVARAADGEADARLEVLRKLEPVAARDLLWLRALTGPEMPHLEPAEALLGVVREVRLTELAVVDAVDAGGDLLLDDLGDGPAEPVSQRLLVVWLPGGLGHDHLADVQRPGQAPGVHGEDAVGASLHRRALALACRIGGRPARMLLRRADRGDGLVRGRSRRSWPPGDLFRWARIWYCLRAVFTGAGRREPSFPARPAGAKAFRRPER